MGETTRKPANTDAVTSRVIRAAGGHEAELTALAGELGLGGLVPVLLSEVLFRADPAPVRVPSLVELVVEHDGQRSSHVLRVAADQPPTPSDEPPDQAVMRVEYRLTDLARELFGPPRDRQSGVRGTRMFPYAPQDGGVPALLEFFAAEVPYPVFLHSVFQATEVVLSGCASRPPDLERLAVKHFSDKWGGLHWFTPHYDRHFRALRGAEVRVLEIGIGGYGHPEAGGGSLKMWKHYFPRGHVFGLDIFDKSHLDEQRITTLRGDQSDPEQLVGIARRHGPFDVVIDDGSHVNEHIRTSFRTLFPFVRPGGRYVIEDLWTAFCPGFGGAEDPARHQGTSLGLLKSLVDALQDEERPPASGEPDVAPAIRGALTGLHVYHNIAFLEKGRNDEGGVPAWVPRSIDALVPPGTS
ncbi:class I SAM-dependent methyltransferase [Saccharothrix australiensis]|uniref:Demethylmacrocin O-methyltransferase n=1 Tax=Saccharothrix australiensis TaxID=2072 RepID=A0A495W745_9PSEU|nr:class I SAM-dependent methyltransferase [Saccharothrix australiensis]RKT55628.1 demethylmacrocin O-methyltransferase [Saccharothrix australiensis]